MHEHHGYVYVTVPAGTTLDWAYEYWRKKLAKAGLHNVEFSITCAPKGKVRPFSHYQQPKQEVSA